MLSADAIRAHRGGPGRECGVLGRVTEDELLVSDLERDQISGVLSEHMAEGRLTADELEQRVGRLLEARTRAQAAAVVADLPPLDAQPSPEHHFHLGHEHEAATPVLPTWVADVVVSSLQTTAAPPSPGSAAEQRAAARKREKLRDDENAIGHAFQARRRAIAADLDAAAAAGDHDATRRLEDELRDAKSAADAGRSAVAAGDRAEAQRQLQRLRARR